MRIIYECLVQLHPRKFRTRFGDDMLWIFNEATRERDAHSLVLDAFLSLLRQWFLRQRTDAFLELFRGALDSVCLPLIITLNLAVFGQFVAFFTVGGPPVIKWNQAIPVWASSTLCLGAFGLFRSLMLLRSSAAFYVWLKLN